MINARIVRLYYSYWQYATFLSFDLHGNIYSFEIISGLGNSSLTLRSLPNLIKHLKEWLPSESSWHICYRASENGWLSSTFHSRCDYKGPTVTIIRIDSYIFGGYTDKSWGGDVSIYNLTENNS